MWKSTFFARFSLSGSRYMSDAITSTKLEAETVWLHGYLRFQPGAWKWNEALPCLCADCKKKKNLSHWFCLNSATVYQIGRSYLGIFLGFFETFLEGSVDLIIYRDYIVIRRFFIYCSLACWQKMVHRAVRYSKQLPFSLMVLMKQDLWQAVHKRWLTKHHDVLSTFSSIRWYLFG